MTRQGAAFTARLRGAATLRPGAAAEEQRWGRSQSFPGRVAVERRESALATARSWRKGRDTLRTDGSRMDSGKVRAAVVWWAGAGWEDRPFRPGNNQVYDAEVYATYRALKIFEQRKEIDRHYTTFLDPASAVDRARSDSMDPGQRFVIAIHPPASGRVVGRSSMITVRWMPAHHGVERKEVANTWAKVAAAGRLRLPGDDSSNVRLSHMARRATGTRT